MSDIDKLQENINKIVNKTLDTVNNTINVIKDFIPAQTGEPNAQGGAPRNNAEQPVYYNDTHIVTPPPPVYDITPPVKVYPQKYKRPKKKRAPWMILSFLYPINWMPFFFAAATHFL